MDVLDGNLKAVEALGFRRCEFHCKIAAKVLVALTMPSDATKKARTCEMKWHSLSVRRFQSVVSVLRSISSAVQNEASACLYMLQMYFSRVEVLVSEESSSVEESELSESDSESNSSVELTGGMVS